MMLRAFGTHDGSFHADEVTACALLLVFNQIDANKIVRSRDPNKLKVCEYLCDVGGIYNPDGKRFDHHQVEYQGDLSSAGMVWKYLKDTGVVEEELYRFFNRSLILGVDAYDNGRVLQDSGSCTFSQVIANFVPPFYDAPREILEKAFFEALVFTQGHLTRLLERFRYIEACRRDVSDAMAPRKKYLFFDKAMPWMDNFFDMDGEHHPALFVIMPAGGHWKLRGIPPTSEERMKVRVPLPEKWGGLLSEELKKASGIPGAVFCHKGRFISVWETKEDAMQALKQIIKGT